MLSELVEIFSEVEPNERRDIEEVDWTFVFDDENTADEGNDPVELDDGCVDLLRVKESYRGKNMWQGTSWSVLQASSGRLTELFLHPHALSEWQFPFAKIVCLLLDCGSARRHSP